MAIDTRNKRASAISGTVYPLIAWPEPDGSLASQADRQHMAGWYAVALTPVVAATFAPLRRILERGFVRVTENGFVRTLERGRVRVLEADS